MPEVFQISGFVFCLCRRWLAVGVLVLTVLLLSSCGIDQQLEPLPSLIPQEQLPTVIAQTSEALASQTAAVQPSLQPTSSPIKTKVSATVSKTPQVAETRGSTKTPSVTLTPTISPTTTETPTPTVTQTPTPDFTVTPPSPDEIPFATVQIVRPGANSKVVSPIDFYTFVAPGEDGRIRVELTGEDGRLLFRQVFVFTETPAGARIKLNASINFEIVGVSEMARLTVSVNDAYERLKALSSVDLVLLADGQADLNPTGDLLAEIYIQQPTIKSLVQGDAVMVSGLARTADNEPLLVELVAANGNIIGSRLAGIAPLQAGGGHRLFAAEVPYSVTSPTWVRIAVQDRSGRLPGLKNVSSVEVLLSP